MTSTSQGWLRLAAALAISIAALVLAVYVGNHGRLILTVALVLVSFALVGWFLIAVARMSGAVGSARTDSDPKATRRLALRFTLAVFGIGLTSALLRRLSGEGSKPTFIAVVALLVALMFLSALARRSGPTSQHKARSDNED